MITINVSGFLTDFTGGRHVIQLSGAPETVGEALNELWQTYPGLRDRVLYWDLGLGPLAFGLCFSSNPNPNLEPKTKDLRPKTQDQIPKTEGNLMKATWNGVLLAQSDDTVVVEGNHYFPPDSLNKEYFQNSDTHTICPWKGQASYFNVVVDGAVNKDAAWYYPEVKPAAEEIKNRVAFWRGVKVE